MRGTRVAAAAAALFCTGCLQLSVVVRIEGNGSGTIACNLHLTTAALAELRQLAALSGSASDPLSEERLRLAADAMGPGVSVISVTASRTQTGEERSAVYAFSDINQLRISPHRLQERSGSATAGTRPTDSQIGFAFARAPDGRALVRITMPLPNVPGLISTRPGKEHEMSAERLAQLKQMYAGMRISFVVEPIGRLVGTTSPFVDGRQVTLVDLDFDRLLADEEAVVRLQRPLTVEGIRAVLKDVPGARICLDPEIAIEFAPDTP